MPSDSPVPAVDGLDAAKLIAGALSPVSSPAFAWEPPTVAQVAPWFPDYEVQALAGRGSMGAVYRAMQRKLERPVAIKLLPPALAAREGAVARFEREARAMAQLNHPHIVALHDYGRTAEGHLYIVMEYVDGADLSRLIHAEGGGLSVPQALEIVTQVCDALQYAHSRGFVHRDIKPGNVLVDKDGRVKIADFGLAKFVARHSDVESAPHATLESRATLTGTVLGTPDYTAPEQLKGGTVDHRADIYSLGVMFYEMLTGDLPRGAWELPSKCTAAPARLDEVVTRAMQSEPDKRYQQASEVKTAVQGSAVASQTSGRLPGITSRIVRELGRTRLGVAAFLVWVILGLGALAGFITSYVMEAFPHNTRGELRFLEAMKYLCLTMAVICGGTLLLRRAAGSQSKVQARPLNSPRLTNRILFWLMFGCFVWMAFVTPTGDMLSLLMVAGPCLILAFLFFFRRRIPAGPVSAFLAGGAVCFAIVMTVLSVLDDEKAAEAGPVREIQNLGDELKELRAKYTDDHPAVKALLNRIDAAAYRSRSAQDAALRARAREASGRDAAINAQRLLVQQAAAEMQALQLKHGISDVVPLSGNSVPPPQNQQGQQEYVQAKQRYEAEVKALHEMEAGAREARVEAAKPSERAIQDLNKLINELADAQAGLEGERQQGVTRFWSGQEQQELESKLKYFQDAVQSRINAGFATDDPRVKEAQQRYALLGKAFEEMRLPWVAPEDCLSQSFRTGFAVNNLFPTGEELIPGLRVFCWKGQHPMDAAAYYVESRAIEPEKPATTGKEKSLEDFPEFWPLDMPVERPRLPAASPQSNAELEWIAKTWPKECAADGLGLVVAEFPLPVVADPDPQLKWSYWSRSSPDRIAWAQGEPQAGGKAKRGRVIFKGGKCFTVFDTAPRPQLFGGTYVDAITWAARTLTHHEMPGALRYLIASDKERKLLPPSPEWHREIWSLYGDFTARECVAYQEKVAKSNPPWRSWLLDRQNLLTAQEMIAGTNTGEGIPFHHWYGSRILVTKFVCSRDTAVKIAVRCGATLPKLGAQEELDSLARLVPESYMAHCDLTTDALTESMDFWKGNRANGWKPISAAERTVPPGHCLSVFNSIGNGLLMPVPSRALLILEFPEAAGKGGRRRVKFPD